MECESPGARPMTLAFPAVNLRRAVRPSLWHACRSMWSGSWPGARGSLERDLSQAAAGLFGFDGDSPHALFLATSPAEYLAVLDEVNIDTPNAPALRALAEGTSALGSVTSACALAPIQLLVGEFMLPLTGAQILRQMPEVTVVPVTSNITA